MKALLTSSLALCLSTVAFGATPSQDARLIQADLAQVKGPFSRMGEVCVGAGRANEGLRADFQRQLAEVKRECGFNYLRFHGLLCDDMGVYIVDSKGRAHYNFQYIDELFDSMLGMGVKPFVELGFMPSGLASGSATIFWWKGNVTPPRDPAQWEALIKALVTHWTERYGEEEVASWYFEVWNEPNLSGFWLGDQGNTPYPEWEKRARAEYLKLYETTARAVKSVNTKYRVGGPATAGNAWLPETIAHCAEKGIPLDFVSTHHYAVISGFLDEKGDTGTIISPNRNDMIDQVRNSRAQIQASAKPGLELHYTEWSSSYTPSDPFHDSYHSAAFILNKLRGIGDAAQSMSYWTFTDIFEEAGPRWSAFHGGFGLMNYQGIRKPSFYAYQFLHRMGDTELVNHDMDAWVTTAKDGSVQALFWDFTLTHPGTKVNNQDFYNKDQPALGTKPARLSLRGLKPGVYQLTGYKVGYRANDAYSAYIDMGSPAQLTRAQVARLKDAGDGRSFISEQVTVGADGVLERTYEMRQNDVIQILLKR